MTELAEPAGRMDKMVEGAWMAVANTGQSVWDAEWHLCEAEECLQVMEWSCKV